MLACVVRVDEPQDVHAMPDPCANAPSKPLLMRAVKCMFYLLTSTHTVLVLLDEAQIVVAFPTETPHVHRLTSTHNVLLDKAQTVVAFPTETPRWPCDLLLMACDLAWRAVRGEGVTKPGLCVLQLACWCAFGSLALPHVPFSYAWRSTGMIAMSGRLHRSSRLAGCQTEITCALDAVKPTAGRAV
jgi:hypothetical protein